MSDDLNALVDQIHGWQAPPKDLPSVLRRGRKVRLARQLGGVGLVSVLLVGVVIGSQMLRGDERLTPATNTRFAWVEEAARHNGVLVELAEVDGSWKHAPEDGRDELLPPFEADPIPVLVTSPRLGRGLEEERAWASIIDGYRPGPAIRKDGSGGASRMFLTLMLDEGGTVFLPLAPPYEDWGAIDIEEDASSEPSGFWVTHDWEGTQIEHPSNWRRSERTFDPGGRATVLTLTSMSELPRNSPRAVRTGYDMSGAPTDAVVVEITKSSGGPAPGFPNQPVGTEGKVEGGFKISIDDEMASVWFYVGPEATDEQRAAADRMLLSIAEAPPEDPGFRRFQFTLGEERWGGTLEVTPDATSVCITLSASFDEVHLHGIGQIDPVSTWFSAIGNGADYCLSRVAETTIRGLVFSPERYEVEAHGGPLDGDRAQLEELSEAEHEPRVSMGFGRLPDVPSPPCPGGEFSARVSDEKARDFAERIMEASNGPEADPRAMWQLLDSSLKASIGDFRTLRRLMRETDVGERYRSWEVSDRVDHGVEAVDVCENVPSRSISMPSAFFPSAKGVSGAAVQLFLVTRSSGPKLWFIY